MKLDTALVLRILSGVAHNGHFADGFSGNSDVIAYPECFLRSVKSFKYLANTYCPTVSSDG